MSGTSQHLSQYALEAFLVGELPSSRCRSVEHHLERCSHCRERLEQIRAAAEGFRAEADHEAILAEIERRLTSSPPSPPSGTGGSVLVRAAGVLLIALVGARLGHFGVQTAEPRGIPATPPSISTATVISPVMLGSSTAPYDSAPERRVFLPQREDPTLPPSPPTHRPALRQLAVPTANGASSPVTRRELPSTPPEPTEVARAMVPQPRAPRVALAPTVHRVSPAPPPPRSSVSAARMPGLLSGGGVDLRLARPLFQGMDSYWIADLRATRDLGRSHLEFGLSLGRAAVEYQRGELAFTEVGVRGAWLPQVRLGPQVDLFLGPEVRLLYLEERSSAGSGWGTPALEAGAQVRLGYDLHPLRLFLSGSAGDRLFRLNGELAHHLSATVGVGFEYRIGAGR